MKTPIYDFINEYSASNSLRAHMPGHKGIGPLGIEKLDITEISGADSLYEASGIIRESENNASFIFGANTIYSTEGSSLCIRAMLYLCTMLSADKTRVLATRNAHRSFIGAAALLDVDVTWIYPKKGDSYVSCSLSPEEIEEYIEFAIHKPTALFLTSPDYLGNMLDIEAISKICKRYGVLLCVDNAHGSYLKFLENSLHPIDLGADMCCDSAHKTLPVLTGGAYLHINKTAPEALVSHSKAAMSLFGSTSPSYLILASLDAANKYLSSDYRERLSEFLFDVRDLRTKLIEYGYTLVGDEPLKLTIDAEKFGYSGKAIAELLEKKGIATEYSDAKYVVLMLTEQLGKDGLSRIDAAFASISMREPIVSAVPRIIEPRAVMSLFEALKKPHKVVPVAEAVGKIAAFGVASCPPAIDIIVGGEKISKSVVDVLIFYGFDSIAVIDE